MCRFLLLVARFSLRDARDSLHPILFSLSAISDAFRHLTFAMLPSSFIIHEGGHHFGLDGSLPVSAHLHILQVLLMRRPFFHFSKNVYRISSLLPLDHVALTHCPQLGFNLPGLSHFIHPST